MLPARVKQVVDGLLQSAGRLEAGVRRAVMERVAALAGGSTAATDLPPALAAWVDKVARHAYKCTDEDVAALREAGEDQIFEATLAAAVGVSVARFERGLALLGHGK